MATGMSGRKTTSKTTEKKYLCVYCNYQKKESEFYISTDPLVMTGKTTMCKACAEKIARNWDPRNKAFGDCTKESAMEALERLDKPFFESLWDDSYFEFVSTNKYTSIWPVYMKNVGMKQYKTLRWRDGDIFSKFRESAVKEAKKEVGIVDKLDATPKIQEINVDYQKNRTDVIRLLGYDPFEAEDEADKPLLYSQLIGYLDLSGDNDDMMRTSSAITIVRGFLQQSKLDNQIAKCMNSPSIASKASEIKQYMESKQKVGSTITQLAAESCLSLKHNKNASKGENTWTGKIKKIKELNLREGEVNGFDLATCRGMQQVMDLSNQSILKALALDESEYADIVAEQRKLVTKLTAERDNYKEITRILLRENLDLKDTLEDHNLLNEENLINLEDLFSPYSEAEKKFDIHADFDDTTDESEGGVDE